MTMPELQEYLWTAIPITRQMGLRLESVASGRISVSLPLSPNVNHKGTIFGGSIYSACAFTAYALLLDTLRRAGSKTTNIVIAAGRTRYLRPLSGDATLVAEVGPESQAKLRQDLERAGKARLSLSVQGSSAGELGAEFQGEFVVKTQPVPGCGAPGGGKDPA